MPTYEKVLEVGNSVGLHEYYFWSSFHWLQWAIYISIFLALMAVSTAFLDHWRFEGLGIFMTVVTVIGMMFVFPLYENFSNEHKVNQKNKKEITEYKKDYMHPYLAHQKQYKSEIVYMKIENSSETEGYLYFGSGRISSETHTFLTVSYIEDGKMITRKFKGVPSLTLAASESPYIQYQKADGEIPHFHGDIYNIELFLPQGYKFTDIK